MSKAKLAREPKRQLGQFLTPYGTAHEIISNLALQPNQKILEPSFGDGAFLLAIIDALIPQLKGELSERLDYIFQNIIYGTEIDKNLYSRFFEKLHSRYNYTPKAHNLYNRDFFQWMPHDHTKAIVYRDYSSQNWSFFDWIIGNPPFGGSIDPQYQDALDSIYGFRQGQKIKKETYSFFLVKSFDLLKNHGRIVFICSDTFLTINTMRGLRKLLLDYGKPCITKLNFFSEETNHPMVVLDYHKTSTPAQGVVVDCKFLDIEHINKTRNLSWRINADHAKYFSGATLGDYIIATSGMTIGSNALFLRRIIDGVISEPYEFEIFEDPITLEKEIGRARLGMLSEKQKSKFRELEAKGATQKNVRIVKLAEPRKISIPNQKYRYYNKATNGIIYSHPRWVVYWENEGEAVYTFKKNGNWYLHGVGGKRYFSKSGITWSLIAPRMYTKFLPEGYILDSGAPCAFVKKGINEDELFFILGWMLTKTCNDILKSVINHTRNIQGKDVERLPYPFWVDSARKMAAINLVKTLIDNSINGRDYSTESSEVKQLQTFYIWQENIISSEQVINKQARQLQLFNLS